MSPAAYRLSALSLTTLVLALASSGSYAASMRERMRPTDAHTTSVDQTQAADVSLTTTAVKEQAIQTWVRTSGMLDGSGKILTAELDLRDGVLVQVGQRARAYPVTFRASMYQAKVTRVTPKEGRVVVEVTLPVEGRDRQAPYLLEIVVDRGRFLAVPNAAIIEEGDTQVVYIQHHPGHYVPTEIHTGLQGELYTQVLHGLEGGEQVVTFGSFFVDAQHKLKDSGGNAAMGHEHHHH
jgi:hypothetical protein